MNLTYKEKPLEIQFASFRKSTEKGPESSIKKPQQLHYLDASIPSKAFSYQPGCVLRVTNVNVDEVDKDEIIVCFKKKFFCNF